MAGGVSGRWAGTSGAWETRGMRPMPASSGEGRPIGQDDLASVAASDSGEVKTAF